MSKKSEKTSKKANISTENTSIVNVIKNKLEKKRYAWGIAINHVSPSLWKLDKTQAMKEAQFVQDKLIEECTLEQLVDLLSEMESKSNK